MLSTSSLLRSRLLEIDSSYPSMWFSSFSMALLLVDKVSSGFYIAHEGTSAGVAMILLKLTSCTMPDMPGSYTIPCDDTPVYCVSYFASLI